MSKFEAIYDEKRAEIPVEYNIKPCATIGEFFEYLETRVDDEVTVHIAVLNHMDNFDRIGSAMYVNGKKASSTTFSDFLDCKVMRIEGAKKGNSEILRLLAF